MAANKCKKCGNSLNLSNCSSCGLPEDLCTCAALEMEEQKIRIFVEKRKFGKSITIVEGITDRGKEVASELKKKLATGGTFKKGHIELLGNHKERLKDILIRLGYSEDQIELG